MRSTIAGPSSGVFLRQLGVLFRHGTATGLSEGELLERFVRGNDESAFEALIARHGPMVLGVCRRLLRDPNDVDDAFQATFLVLVRKAGTLRSRDLLGNWLYGVAFRVARRARAVAARRSARAPFGTGAIDELEVRDGDSAPAPDAEAIPWLHEEVRRLPEKYRVPVLLCYFEGLTHEEAAARLGWPIGTVKGRLSRARDLLRKRLIRRGVDGPSLAFPGVRIAVPEALRTATIRAACAVAGSAGGSILGVSSLSLPVATLTDGVLRAMILTHLKSAGLALIVAGAVTTGLVLAAGQEPARPDQRAEDSPAATDLVKAESTPPQRNAAVRKKAAPAGVAPSRLKGTGRAGDQGGSGGATGGIGIGGFGGGRADPESTMGRQMAEQRAFRNRLAIVQLSSALAASDKNPKNRAVMAKLDQPLTMAFPNETPLDDVLKYIKSATAEPNGKAIPVYVDPIGLQEAERSLNSTVQIDLEGIPLKMSLRLLLKQLEMAYCVREGVLIISSVEGIRQELAEEASELMENDPKLRDALMQLGFPNMGGGGMGMM